MGMREQLQNLLGQGSVSSEVDVNDEVNSMNSLNNSVFSLNNSVRSNVQVASLNESNISGVNNNSNRFASVSNNFSPFVPQQVSYRRFSAQADFQLTKTLVDMGFSEDQAKRALQMTGNNLNAAADLLLSNENLDDLSYQSFPMIRVPNFNASSNRFQGVSTGTYSNVPNQNVNVVQGSNENSNLSVLNSLVINNLANNQLEENSYSIHESQNHSEIAQELHDENMDDNIELEGDGNDESEHNN